MRISLGDTWLTNDGMTDLHAWTDAQGVRLNGRQIVQDAEFLRAVAATPLARGNRVNVLRFTVTRQHPSVAEASAYALTMFSSLPADGTALVVCGAYGESPLACTFSAVLEEMPECAFHGTRTDMTFVLRGGLITTAAPLSATGVDGATFGTAYSYAQGGTVDGGNLADALTPVSMNLDGGTWT